MNPEPDTTAYTSTVDSMSVPMTAEPQPHDMTFVWAIGAFFFCAVVLRLLDLR